MSPPSIIQSLAHVCTPLGCGHVYHVLSNSQLSLLRLSTLEACVPGVIVKVNYLLL